MGWTDAYAQPAGLEENGLMKPTFIRGALVLLVLLGQIISICFVLLSTQKQTALQFSANADIKLNDFARNVTETTEHFLAPAADAVQVGQSLLIGSVISANNDMLLERYFLAKLKSIDSLSGIYFGRPDGSFLFVTRGQDGLRTKQITMDDQARQVTYTQYSEFGPERTWLDEEDTYDPRVRPWYTSANQSESLIWTNPYTFFSSGKPGISAAINVVSKSGEHLGVIGVDVDITDLSQFISLANDDGSRTAIIIDEEQNVVAYSRGLYQSGQEKKGSDHRLFKDIDDAPLADLYQLGIAASNDGIDNTLETIKFSSNDVSRIGLLREFSVTGNDSQWFLLAQLPEAEYSGGVTDLFAQDIWVLISTVLIPGLILAALVMRLTAPVERYYNEASIDKLTGALTRTEFKHRIDKLAKNVRRADDPDQLTIAVLDLDGFKAVNDNYDHAEGDAVLCEIAQRLQGRLRDGDLVGRLGGDEFVIAMRTRDGTDFLDAMDNIRARAVRETITTSAAEHRVGMTAGVAVWQDGDSFEAVLNRADRALVDGKRKLKNRSYLDSNYGNGDSHS